MKTNACSMRVPPPALVSIQDAMWRLSKSGDKVASKGLDEKNQKHQCDDGKQRTAWKEKYTTRQMIRERSKKSREGAIRDTERTKDVSRP
jgi:hypothetical protein